jgi:hypothetical protein
VSYRGGLACGTQRQISETHPKQPTNPPRGVNVRFGKFVGVQYLVLWFRVETQTAPIDKGCGIDFTLCDSLYFVLYV